MIMQAKSYRVIMHKADKAAMCLFDHILVKGGHVFRVEDMPYRQKGNVNRGLHVAR